MKSCAEVKHDQKSG